MSDDGYLFDHVERLEREAARVRERALAVSSQIFTVPIPQGLGTVRVTGSGVLAAVQLDPRVRQTMRPDSVGGHIVTAITRAEQQAAAARAVIGAEESAWRRE